MKKPTIILLISLVLISCKAQTPDAYSQRIVDSLNAVIFNSQLKIDSLENLYSEKVIYLSVPKTILFNESGQLSFDSSGFEFSFYDKTFLYVLRNVDNDVKIIKAYRDSSLKINLTLQLNE